MEFFGLYEYYVIPINILRAIHTDTNFVVCQLPGNSDTGNNSLIFSPFLIAFRDVFLVVYHHFAKKNILSNFKILPTLYETNA